jgi:epoxyqueuosine reductase
VASVCTELSDFLSATGYTARIVSIARVSELQSLLERLKQDGSVSAAFYPELTRYFNFDYAKSLPGARSIIIIASPQPPTRVAFGDQTVIIPPTYIYRDIWKGQLTAVTEFLEPRGFRVARARLPFKTLAVRSGLAKYGRNNISYIEGMGSFHRLGAFYSDAPCGEDSWNEPQSMRPCQTCKVCLKACPTGCIADDRFLIHADRCLTHFNENEKTLPDWIKAAWHNALLGCMECQKACPVNKPHLGSTREAEVVFSESETRQILDGEPLDTLTPELKAKLESLCLTDEDVYPLLKRNLSLLLKR